MSLGRVLDIKKATQGWLFLSLRLTCWRRQREKRLLLLRQRWQQPWRRRRPVRWQPQLRVLRVQQPAPVPARELALLFCHKRQGLRLR